MLRQGAISCAFAREDYSDINGDFERIKITSDRLVCLVPEGHPRAKDKTISIRELKGEKILYYEQSTMMRSLFLGAGFTIPDASIGAKGRNALLLVKQGLGIMLEFRKPIDDSELGGFSILDIEPEVRSDINFVYLPHALSDTGRRFVSFIKRYARTNPPQA
ncbi:MAG: LysR family transcriptional regulator substrate-binding protein [Clostridiales bacterium]|nr:LysR family transcriptional regulator substrate-binding protein [Clostridiales bacterium]